LFVLSIRTNHEQSQGRPCKRSIHSRSFTDLATSSSARSKEFFFVNDAIAKSIVASPRSRTSPAADGGFGAASAASARACACRDRRTSCRAACCARRSVSAATATAADADADVEMPTDDEVDIKIVR
jgi:hypothetical protein